MHLLFLPGGCSALDMTWPAVLIFSCTSPISSSGLSAAESGSTPRSATHTEPDPRFDPSKTTGQYTLLPSKICLVRTLPSRAAPGLHDAARFDATGTVLPQVTVHSSVIQPKHVRISTSGDGSWQYCPLDWTPCYSRGQTCMNCCSQEVSRGGYGWLLITGLDVAAGYCYTYSRSSVEYGVCRLL